LLNMYNNIFDTGGPGPPPKKKIEIWDVLFKNKKSIKIVLWELDFKKKL